MNTKVGVTTTTVVFSWKIVQCPNVSRVHYRISQPLYIRPVTAVPGVVTSSEVNRPDFHLGTFGGVFVSFPVEPVHAVSDRRVLTVVVQAVQVGVVAGFVPPGAFVHFGAVLVIWLVILSVFGAERHRIVIRQWIARCTCEKSIWQVVELSKFQYSLQNYPMQISCSVDN